MLSQEHAPRHVLLGLACLAALACGHGRPDGRVGWTEEEWRLESVCQEGDVGACRDLATRLVQEGRTEKDLDRGLVLLEMACGRDDWKACGALGDRYLGLGGRDQRGKLDRAVEVLARACAHGSATACTHQGEAILRNRADRDAAQPAFLEGCNLGDPVGCEGYAAIEMRSRAHDTDQAEQALARACQLSRLDACDGLARMLWNRPQRQPDAIRLWVGACDQGLDRSCQQLIALGAPLLSSTPDCGLIRGLAHQRCLTGDRNACAVRAACQLREGRDDAAALVESLSSACAARHALSCLYWADAVGSSRDADRKRIRQALSVACRDGQLGHRTACTRMRAQDLQAAETLEESDQAAVELAGYCSEGEAEACCELGKAHQTGKGVAKDVERAERLFRKACALGRVACCPATTPADPPVPKLRR